MIDGWRYLLASCELFREISKSFVHDHRWCIAVVPFVVRARRKRRLDGGEIWTSRTSRIWFCRRSIFCRRSCSTSLAFSSISISQESNHEKKSKRRIWFTFIHFTEWFLWRWNERKNNWIRSRRDLRDYRLFLVILELDLREWDSSLSEYPPFVVHLNMYRPARDWQNALDEWGKKYLFF